MSTPSAGAAGRVPFPSGSPLSMPWPDAAHGGLGAAAPSMASPPQPQPPMGPPGAAYGEAAASSLGMSYLQGQACDAATYAAVGPGVGMSAVGMGGMGGAPPWAPSSPQLVPHGHPPHGPSSGERGWLGYEYGLPHGHPTVQENPAGSSDMPVKLFVGIAALSGAPSWRRQSLGRWPATICTSCLHLMSAAPGGSGRLGTGQGVGERRRHRPSHYREGEPVQGEPGGGRGRGRPATVRGRPQGGRGRPCATHTALQVLGGNTERSARGTRLLQQRRHTFVSLYGHAGMHAWVQGTPPAGLYYLPSGRVVELRPLVEVAVTLAKPPAPVAAPAPPGKSSIVVSF